MAVASLVLGVVGLVLSFVAVGIIPALIGVVLSIVSLTKKKDSKAIAGLVCSILGIIVFMVLLSVSMIRRPETTPNQVSGTTQVESQVDQTSNDVAKKSSSTVSPGNAVIQSSEAANQTPAVSSEYIAALKKAQSYSDRMFMSKARLYDQLTSQYGEKFPEDAAKYAVENVKADWNYNALQKAKSYRNNQNMSTDRIYQQLTSQYGEQFTDEQAKYAIEHLND